MPSGQLSAQLAWGLPGKGQSGGGRPALSHAKPGAAKGQAESLGVT